MLLPISTPKPRMRTKMEITLTPEAAAELEAFLGTLPPMTEEQKAASAELRAALERMRQQPPRFDPRKSSCT